MDGGRREGCGEVDVGKRELWGGGWWEKGRL